MQNRKGVGTKRCNVRGAPAKPPLIAVRNIPDRLATLVPPSTELTPREARLLPWLGTVLTCAAVSLPIPCPVAVAVEVRKK